MKTLLLALVFALTTPATHLHAESTGRKEEKVTLKQGQKKSFADGELEFLKIVTDSRCPPEAQCVWAGMIVGEFRVKVKDVEKTIQLGSSAGAPMQIKTDETGKSSHSPGRERVGALTFALASVETKQAGKKSKKSYTVTVSIAE